MGRAFLAALLALVVGEGVSGAFSPDGHEVVEALAYRDLIGRDHVAGTGVAGREIIAYLIRRGVLARPRCFDAKPDDRVCGREASRQEPIDSWPIPGTGSLDLGGPRFSYVHRDQNRATPLALRFSWRWPD